MAPKKLVTLIAAAIVLCSAILITSYILRFGFGKIGTQSTRFILTCLLAYSLVRGWNPGRWIAVVLMGLAGVVSILGGIGMIMQSGMGYLLVLLGFIYVACVVGLLIPPGSRHFSSTE